MDFFEKARMRMEHWMKHNQDHIREYEKFARDLEENGKNESAAEIFQMAGLLAQADEHLKKAVQDLA